MVRFFGNEVSGLLLFLVLLNLYFLVLYILVKTGWLQRLGMSLFGPALMVKTERGRGILDFLAKPRAFWRVVATVGTALTFVVMGLMTLLLVAQLPFVFRVPVSEAPSFSLILGIPGINPIIPLGYGLLALIFAVVVHEMSHGVLARVHDLKVKTMGLLLLIVPIGAFVEPDEEALKRAPRRHRVQVFGAGPTSNLFFAFLFAAIFSGVLMAQASPAPGAPVMTVDARGPACQAGILPSWIIDAAGPGPGSTEPIPDRDSLSRFLNSTTPGDVVWLHVRETSRPASEAARECTNETNQDSGIFPVRTVRCVELYGADSCRENGALTGHPDPLNRTVIGINLYDTQEVYAALSNPFSSPSRALAYFSLPFFALPPQNAFPLAGPFQDFYDVPFHEPTFWALANLAYWLFWINLMLGLTNALPMLPLDGGHMFRDLVGHWIQKRRPLSTPEERDASVRRLSMGVTFTLLSLVLLQFVGPYIAALAR